MRIGRATDPYTRLHCWKLCRYNRRRITLGSLGRVYEAVVNQCCDWQRDEEQDGGEFPAANGVCRSSMRGLLAVQRVADLVNRPAATCRTKKKVCKYTTGNVIF